MEMTLYIKYKLHDRQQREKLHISLLEVSTWGERRRRAAALQEVDWRGRNFLMWIRDERSDGSSKRELWVVVMMEFKSQIFMLWISWRFIDHIKFSHIAPNESLNDAPSSLNTVTKSKYICYSSLFFGNPSQPRRKISNYVVELSRSFAHCPTTRPARVDI